MRKLWRVLLELFGPAILGGTLMFFFVISNSDQPIKFRNVFWVLIVYMAFALIFCGIQSVVYTIVMEWAYSRGMNRRSIRSVCLSCILGALSGFAILAIPPGKPFDSLSIRLFPGIGTIVGASIASIIYLLEPKRSTDHA
jgi:hypothetical protein